MPIIIIEEEPMVSGGDVYGVRQRVDAPAVTDARPAETTDQGETPIAPGSGYSQVQQTFNPATPRADAGFELFKPRGRQESPRGVTILHSNDLHGAIAGDDGRYLPGGLARLTGAIEKIAQDNQKRGYGTVVLIAGDVFTGGGDYSDGKLIVEALAAMRLELQGKGIQFAAVLGNHELDHGVEAACGYMKAAGFPVLGGNIGVHDNESQSSHQFADSSAVLEVGGAKIAVVGLTTNEGISSKALAQNGGRIAAGDPVPAADAGFAEVEGEKPDATVLLAHVGDGAQKEALAGIARDRNADVIIGGHSHDPEPMQCSESFSDCSDVQGVPYCRVPADPKGGLYLGVVDINLDGSEERVTSRTIGVGRDVSPNANVARAIKKSISRDERTNPDLYKTAGYLNRDLEFSRSGQCPLGKFVTDAMRTATDADFAVLNSGAMRGPFFAGGIETGEIQATLPYDNKLVTVTMSGLELKELLAKSKAKEGKGDGMYLQVSGDTDSIDPDRQYRVATIDFLVKIDHTYFPKGIKAEAQTSEPDKAPLTLRGVFTENLDPMMVTMAR